MSSARSQFLTWLCKGALREDRICFPPKKLIVAMDSTGYAYEGYDSSINTAELLRVKRLCMCFPRGSSRWRRITTRQGTSASAILTSCTSRNMFTVTIRSPPERLVTLIHLEQAVIAQLLLMSFQLARLSHLRQTRWLTYRQSICDEGF